MRDAVPPGSPDLSTIEVFTGVPAELLLRGRRQFYRDGNVILASGSEPECLVLLLRGHVAIREDGIRIVGREPICLLGELAFIDGRPRSASVIAEGAVETFEIPADDVPALLADPAFLRNLVGELSAKLREATADRAWRYRSDELLFGSLTAHVSREYVQELLATGHDGTPRTAEVVTMFADIRSFTDTSGQMAVEDLARDLGAYFDAAVEIVHRHGGMVDKFIGDAVMAVWGYVSRADDRTEALACAEDLVRCARTLTLGGSPIRVGAGIESGLAMLGVIGGEGKRSFTVIGQPVNTAARLESETKALKADICVGPDFEGHLPDEVRSRLAGPTKREIKGVGELDVFTLDVKDE